MVIVKEQFYCIESKVTYYPKDEYSASAKREKHLVQLGKCVAIEKKESKKKLETKELKTDKNTK